MKPVLLLLLAMLAIKTTTTTAIGQDACSKAYVGCVDKCVARPTPQLQEGCMQACQTQNNACYSQVFGGPGPNAVTVRQEDGQPNVTPAGENPEAAALASDEKKAKKPARKRAERRAQ